MTQPPKTDPLLSNGLNKAPNVETSLVGEDLQPSPPRTSISTARSAATENQTELSQPESLPSTPPLASPTTQSRSSSQHRSESRSRHLPNGLYGSTTLTSANDGLRQLVYRSFAPRIAVFSSPDTEEFIRGKGFDGGLCALLRPYGENVQGKVIIRDSIGGSKGWEGFGVRFVYSQTLHQSSSNSGGWDSNPRSPGSPFLSSPRVNSDPSQSIETSIKQYLLSTHRSPDIAPTHHDSQAEAEDNTDLPASPYQHYLCKILSSSPPVPFETFSHPVACMVCVSSHNPAPIDTLRQLYAQTNPGNGRIPGWISTEYLRYYVLIHDDENDDITKSTALFDLMKRHFGLHCHLLRLKSSRCSVDDEDSVQVPSARWISAEEELAVERMKGSWPARPRSHKADANETDYTEESRPSESFIAESDSAAIRGFLREMVVQSMVPFMETRVMTWNDQVASRRRGISGRFMSLSKRFAGFGGSKSSSSSPAAGQSSNSNFNAQEGYYPNGTPEATMRQLADYAFMLRDWKLAYAIYDLLRSDYGHDKAWQYHAAANEMAAVTSILNAHTLGSRYRADLVDQMLDLSIYSYLTRSSMPWGVVRCLTTAVELIKSLGPLCADDGRRWGSRLLESDVLRPYSQAMATGRIADCYNSRLDMLSLAAGPRKRQAAFWNVLTSASWSKVDRTELSQTRLREAESMYCPSQEEKPSVPFASMQEYWDKLSRDAKVATEDIESTTLIDTSVQQVQLESTTPRARRLSMAFSARPTDDRDSDDEGFTSQDAGGLMYDNES